jgi:DNA-directed RNA polymerase subunit RPC12/RpoP
LGMIKTCSKERRPIRNGKCAIYGCVNQPQSNSLCHRHYEALRHNRLGHLKPCPIPGCTRLVNSNVFCPTHHLRWTIALGVGRLNSTIRGENNPRWNGGASEYKDHYTMKLLRKEVLEEANYICQNCGGPADRIHHIDFDKNHQKKSNYVACCHTCNIGVFHKGRKAKPCRFGLPMSVWAKTFQCCTVDIPIYMSIVQMLFLVAVAKGKTLAWSSK